MRCSRRLCLRVFLKDSGLRQLQADFVSAERLLQPRRLCARYSSAGAEAGAGGGASVAPQALSEVIDRAYQLWMRKREKYADTTPWLLDDLRRTAQELPADWNQNGFTANKG